MNRGFTEKSLEKLNLKLFSRLKKLENIIFYKIYLSNASNLSLKTLLKLKELEKRILESSTFLDNHSSSFVPSAWLLPIIASHLAQGTFRKRNRCTQRSQCNFQRSKHSSNCDNELKPIYAEQASNTIDSSVNDEGNRTIRIPRVSLSWSMCIRIMLEKF